jgi:hypothetical protein
MQYTPLKRRSTIILHGSTSQKTILNNPEDNLHSRRRENRKSQIYFGLFNDALSSSGYIVSDDRVIWNKAAKT